MTGRIELTLSSVFPHLSEVRSIIYSYTKKDRIPYSAIISEAQGTILIQKSPPLAQNLPGECLVCFNINRHLLKWIVCFPYDFFIIMAWLDPLSWGSTGRLGKENFRVGPNCRMSHFADLLLFDQAKGYNNGRKWIGMWVSAEALRHSCLLHT